MGLFSTGAPNAMNKPSVEIIAHVVNDMGFTAVEPPYSQRSATALQLNTVITAEELPEAEHYRVVLALSSQGRDGDDLLRFTATITAEAIVRLQGSFAERETERVLHVEVPARLFAFARERLTSLTQFTGYGPLVLPPVDDDYLRRSVLKTKIDDESKQEVVS